MKKCICTLVCSVLAFLLHAQSDRQILLETKNTALLLSIGANQRVTQSYFGKKLQPADYALLKGGREVYLTAGMENQNEPAIRVVHADGNPSLELQYVAHKTISSGGDSITTSILLRDPQYPFEVTLYYTLYYNEDVIKAWTEIRNNEKKPVQLTAYASSLLHFNANAYWLTQFHGDWAREMNMVEEQLSNGIKTLESKLGTRSNFYQTQVFFVSLDKPSTETDGELIAGTLNWTGNFRYSFEIDQRNGLRVLSGINPFASEYALQPAETFTTPAFLFTWSGNGKGLASRNLHNWARNYGVMDGNGNRMVLLNNWEATDVRFNENRLVELFGEAKKLGADLFLLDDGWFGNKYPRNDDKNGLGDWQEDKAKLPSGLGYLVKEAEKQGVKFGIWLEPEMVNPKSELYEQHPDWILKLPNRPENYGRNQLVLDLTNPKVQDFVFSIVDNMLTKTPGIAFIKWDCNRSMTNAWSPYLGSSRQSQLYIEYTRSFYKVMARIRAKYPTLPIMLCSGGGGRTDYGALKYFTEFWPSDNTDPLSRIYIQWGYSYFFPANTMAAHITGMGKQSLKYKTDVAMMGRMGYDIRTNNFTPQELQFSEEAVKTYKRISPVIWHGDLYRLVSPYENNRAVLMYISKDQNQAILFNYHLNSTRSDVFGKVRLQGLDPKKKYRIKEINLFPGTTSAMADHDKVFSGEYLLQAGLNLSVRTTPLTSNVYELTAEP